MVSLYDKNASQMEIAFDDLHDRLREGHIVLTNWILRGYKSNLQNDLLELLKLTAYVPS